MRSRLLTAAIALAGVCAVPGAALAAPGWTAPADYPSIPADTSGLEQPTIGYQTGGIATVAYLEVDVFSATQAQTVLHVGVVPPGGSYQEQLRIPSSSSLTPFEVALAEAPNGAAVVTWADLEGTDPSNVKLAYLASYRPAGSSTWDAPTTFATDSAVGGGNVVAAISVDGTAAVGIDRVDPTIASGGERVDIAVRPPGGPWGSLKHLSPTSTDSQKLELGFDAQDDLTAAFAKRIAAGKYTLEVSNRAASNGVFGALTDVTSSDTTHYVFLNGPNGFAVAPDGSAVLAFQHTVPASSPDFDLGALTRSGESGIWTAPQDVTTGGGPDDDAAAPVAAGVSADDSAYVLYNTFSTASSHLCVGVTRAHTGLPFSSPQCISPTSFSGSGGAVAFLGNDAYFAWSGHAQPGAANSVQGSRWLDGAAAPEAFTQVESPSATTTFALNTLVPDEDGSVAALWGSTRGTTTTARAAAFDGGGPNLVSTSIPATGVAGQALSMSAGFADLWAGLGGDASWSFGDGTTGTGAQVSHTYAKPGSYTITVTAADKLQNTTTSTHTITITITAAKPKLTGVSQTARTWSEHKLHRHGHKQPPPVGTKFKFTLNEAATVKLVFTHKLTGRRVKHKCKPQTKHNAGDKRCTYTSTAGTTTITADAGSNTYKFTGKLGKHKLAHGTYKLALTATNSAKQHSTTKTLTFHIVG
jgi:hypothetical protein